MRKVINGLMYDTEAANVAASLSYTDRIITSEGASDGPRVEETLHRTSRDNWFLHTRRVDGSGWVGEEIRAVDLTHAANFCLRPGVRVVRRWAPRVESA